MGDPGEIWVRGPNVFAGYWDDPEATARVLARRLAPHGRRRGLATTTGYLCLVDRKKDLVIVSGFNVYPAEVEEVLADRTPTSRTSAVIGVPDARTGEAVAGLGRAEGRELERVTSVDVDLHGHLARFKWPKRSSIVDDLPHHVTGKILAGRSGGAVARQGGGGRMIASTGICCWPCSRSGCGDRSAFAWALLRRFARGAAR